MFGYMTHEAPRPDGGYRLPLTDPDRGTRHPFPVDAGWNRPLVDFEAGYRPPLTDPDAGWTRPLRPQASWRRGG
jgi:hypothetical protein